MPPRYVKAYVKRGKTDAGDAAAICEEVTRPSMSFVPVKEVEQQGRAMLHIACSQLIGQRKPARASSLRPSPGFRGFSGADLPSAAPPPGAWLRCGEGEVAQF